MMYQSDAEILFPARVIPLLRNLRGPEWQTLVDEIVRQPNGSPEEQAFCLMMIRLDGCLTCHSDSYRAMRGCTLCAQQTIARFKGSDADLLAVFQQAYADMARWRETGFIPLTERVPAELEALEISS